MDRVGVVVKVGKTSKIKFKNIKAYRAIDFIEVRRLVSKLDGISAVIIESVLPYELVQAKELIEYVRGIGKTVFIYSLNGANLQEQSISDELGISISNSLDELQHAISKELAVMAYTAWGRQVYGTNIDNNNDSVDNNISDLKEALDELKEPAELNIEIINNKGDLIKILGSSGVNIDDNVIANSLKSSSDYKTDKSYIELSKLLDSVTKEKQDLSSKLGNAFNRIQSLLDIKVSIEAERDRYKQLLESLEAKSKEVENPVPGKQLDDALAQLDKLKSLNMNLEQKVLEYKSEVGVLTGKVVNSERELEGYKETIELLNNDISIKDERIERLSNSLSVGESIKVELANTRADKLALEKKVAVLNDKVRGLTAEVDNAMNRSSTDDLEKIQSLRLEIEDLNNVINETNEKVVLESKGRLVVNMLLSEAISQKRDVSRELAIKDKEVTDLKVLASKLKGSIATSEEEYRQIKIKYDELLSNKDNKDIEINELENKYKDELNSMHIELGTRTQEVKRLKVELDKVKKELDSKEIELSKLLVKAGAESDDVKRVKGMQEELERTNGVLLNTINSLKEEIQSLTSRISMTEDANERLEDSNKKLRANLASFKAATSINSNSQAQGNVVQKVVALKPKLDCSYSGRGLVIPIFGTGSYGITTIAMSLVKKLSKASVLYMDMDMVSPKGDSWFRVSPMSDQLDGIKDRMKRSSFGALLEMGAGYVVDNMKYTCKRVATSKSGSYIDYFSGVYTKVDLRKLMAVDFSELMTYLGNQYSYIIVDLGRYGSSDMSDELIRMFNSISYRKLIVSLNNLYDVRGIRMRLSTDGMSLDNAIWVLNMSDSSVVDNMIKQTLGSARPIIIPKEMSIYGSGNTFDKYPILKDRLNQITEMIIN